MSRGPGSKEGKASQALLNKDDTTQFEPRTNRNIFKFLL